MIIPKKKSLFSILYESPFFIELTMKEKEGLVNDLLQSYPHLKRNDNCDIEIGYEAGWMPRQL